MRRIILIAILLVLSLACKIEDKKNQPLQLTIKSDKEVYEVREKIIIKHELRNISKGKILLNKYIAPGGNLFFEISGTRGPVVAFISAYWRLPENMDFLAPNESIKGTYEISSIRDFKGWRDDPFLAGEHIIKAYLTVYTKSKNNKVEPLDELISNTITIEVVEKK